MLPTRWSGSRAGLPLPLSPSCVCPPPVPLPRQQPGSRIPGGPRRSLARVLVGQGELWVALFARDTNSDINIGTPYAVTVSPDDSRVYVTGNVAGSASGFHTVRIIMVIGLVVPMFKHLYDSLGGYSYPVTSADVG